VSASLLTGPSGSDKTLLLRQLALLDAPENGLASAEGTVQPGLGACQWRSRVAYVAQRPVPLASTVGEDLQLPFRFLTCTPQAFVAAGPHPAWLDRLDRAQTFLHQDTRAISQVLRASFSGCFAPCNSLSVCSCWTKPSASLDDRTTQRLEQLLLTWQAEEGGRGGHPDQQS